MLAILVLNNLWADKSNKEQFIEQEGIEKMLFDVKNAYFELVLAVNFSVNETGRREFLSIFIGRYLGNRKR